VSAGDRLDMIAAKIGGDPEQYWRICDANNVMHPLELTNEPGTTIKISKAWG
jgi:nucleoid-associated protein YgaU